MLIPPPYLDLLDPLPAPPAKRPAAGRTNRAASTVLLAATSGAVAGGLAAWLVIAAAS